MTEEAAKPDASLFGDHPRGFADNRYVYPVVSRRAGGISIGVNLNRDKACNFHCAYCQVDRTTPAERRPIDLDRLAEELSETAALVSSGCIYNLPGFEKTPEALRRLNDVALSGDGEPTVHEQFAEVVAVCAEVRSRLALDNVKLILITNASRLHCEQVERGLEALDAAGGEIWAKLDAGTEPYYRQVARTEVPFRRILDNLRAAALKRPIVIQSLFARIDGHPPPAAELDAYCRRLDEITSAGGRIKLVQVHTVARPPAESWITALSRAEVEAIAEQVRRQTSLAVAAFA